MKPVRLSEPTMRGLRSALSPMVTDVDLPTHSQESTQRRSTMDESPLCKLSRLCDGILPLAGSAAAFVALLALLAL